MEYQVRKHKKPHYHNDANVGTPKNNYFPFEKKLKISYFRCLSLVLFDAYIYLLCFLT